MSLTGASFSASLRLESCALLRLFACFDRAPPPPNHAGSVHISTHVVVGAVTDAYVQQLLSRYRW